MYNKHVGMSLEQCYAENEKLLHFVTRRIMKDFLDPAMDYDDYISIAKIGFIRGYETYEGDRNMKLSSWLINMIDYEIRKSYRDNRRGMKISRRANECSNQIRKENGVITEEIREKYTEEIIQMALEIEAITVYSIDKTANTRNKQSDRGSRDTYTDVTPDHNAEKEYENIANRELISLLLNSVPERNRLLIVDYYFNKVNTVQLAKKYKISQPHISRTINNTLVLFRKMIEEDNFTMDTSSGKIDRVLLKKCLEEGTYTKKQLCEIFNVSFSTLKRCMDDMDIKIASNKDKIIKLLEDGVPLQEIREKMEMEGHSRIYVNSIINEYKKEKGIIEVTKKEIVKKLLQEGKSNKEICEEVKCCNSYINQIKRGIA